MFATDIVHGIGIVPTRRARFSAPTYSERRRTSTMTVLSSSIARATSKRVATHSIFPPRNGGGVEAPVSGQHVQALTQSARTVTRLGIHSRAAAIE